MFPRGQNDALTEALTDTPVVLVAGARQVGKSTLVQSVAEDRPYLTLDDATTLQAATNDAAGFVAGLPDRVVVDEVQRAPELLLAIKASVDRDRSPGRFLLTGSANVLTLPRIADSLTGRMEVLELWPLSQGEIGGRPGNLVDALFSGGSLGAAVGPPKDVKARILTGGYPEVIERATPHRRRAWFRAYVTTILQRDVRDLANIEGLRDMPRLLSLLAARSATVLNSASLARESGLPQSTLKRYLALLEAIYLLHYLPAWSTNLGKRLVKAPKVHLVDSGLTAALLDVDETRLQKDRTLLGHLLETFVITELQKQAGWSRVRPRIYHYRTHDGHEIDILLESPSGDLVAVEAKASSTVHDRDFRSMRALQELLPGRFHRGIVLHDGDTTVPFGERLGAVPIAALWS